MDDVVLLPPGTAAIRDNQAIRRNYDVNTHNIYRDMGDTRQNDTIAITVVDVEVAIDQRQTRH